MIICLIVISGLLVISLVLLLRMYLRNRNDGSRKKDDKGPAESAPSSLYDEHIDSLVDAAREIRTPLLLMKEPLDTILKSANLDTKVRSNLQIIEDNTDKILDISDRLLSASEASSDKYKALLLNYDWDVRVDRMHEDNLNGEHHQKPAILIVESDLDLRMYITSRLKLDYNALSVPDGFEAMRVLESNVIDLVLCDIDIPQYKGTELCQSLKSSAEYSHIPFILMTAGADTKSKIEGMQYGADANIEKPFSMSYLCAVIQNLLDTREHLRKKYANSPWLGISTIALSEADTKFLTRVNEILQEKMEDPQLSIDSIAVEMNMSRSSFYRKIRGLTDMSPNGFLQFERLKKAALLLKEGSLRVNEISSMVGFSSSSYFAKCFQKQFGVLPKEYK